MLRNLYVLKVSVQDKYSTEGPAGWVVSLPGHRTHWLGSGLTLQGLSCEGTKPWLELLRWSVCYFHLELKRQNAAMGGGDGDGNWTMAGVWVPYWTRISEAGFDVPVGYPTLAKLF